MNFNACNTGSEPGALANLYWSDFNPSSVGIVVSNAPGVGSNPFCLDVMYQDFSHPTNTGSITVLITNLPAGELKLLLQSGDGAESRIRRDHLLKALPLALLLREAEHPRDGRQVFGALAGRERPAIICSLQARSSAG